MLSASSEDVGFLNPDCLYYISLFYSQACPPTLYKQSSPFLGIAATCHQHQIENVCGYQHPSLCRPVNSMILYIYQVLRRVASYSLPIELQNEIFSSAYLLSLISSSKKCQLYFLGFVARVEVNSDVYTQTMVFL